MTDDLRSSTIPTPDSLQTPINIDQKNERMFVGMAREALCRLAEHFNTSGKLDRADEVLAFSFSLAPDDAENHLCQSRILSARGQQVESDSIRAMATKQNPWAARLEDVYTEKGSWIRVRRECEVEQFYGYDFDDSPQGLLAALDYARSESGRAEFLDCNDPLGMIIERCSGINQTLGRIDVDGISTHEEGVFAPSGTGNAGQKLVFTNYHWPSLTDKLDEFNSGTASQILMALQDAYRMVEIEVERTDVTSMVAAATIEGVNTIELLRCLSNILYSECEYEMLTRLRKRLKQNGFEPLPSKEAIVSLKTRLYELARLAAQNTYPAMREDLERIGFFAEQEVVEDLTHIAAPKIIGHAYNVACLSRSNSSVGEVR